MRIFFLLILGIHLFCNHVYGQVTFSLTGSVVDERNHPLAGATVFLLPAGKGMTTNSQGRFNIAGLAAGIYTIEISFIGYKPLTDTIRIDTNATYRAQLPVSPQILQEVVVTENLALKKKETSFNIEIVNNDYLKQNLGGSLMKSLEKLPGVKAMDIGSGQSKPVIRGLGFNRVVVVENSIKHEAQQWGADHGLEIDQYAVNSIEVIKGPASLMYGSDAIGGVIDVRNEQVPADNTIGGMVDLSAKTNNEYLGASLLLYGRKKWFFAALRATLLGYGDYKVPTDSVDIYSYRVALYRHHMRNTAGKEADLHFSLGILLPKFQSRFYISNVYAKNGFFANAHGQEPRNVDATFHDRSNRDINYPFQEVYHFKIINNSQYRWRKLKLQTDLGFQRNFRQEWSQYVNHGYMPAIFPDTLGFSSDLEQQFDKYTWSGNLMLSYEKDEKTSLSAGINTEYQDNRIDGRGFIIPAYRQFTIGGYAFVKHALSERSILQAGARYDYGNVNSREYRDWFPSPVVIDGDTTWQNLIRAPALNRVFSSISWSVGYNLNIPHWSFKANMGKSFRMPIAKELAANGVNYHHFSYEVGNPGLSPEISYQLDAGITYESMNVEIGTTPFINYFPNYIYLNPSPEHDRLYGNGNQVFYYTQSEVLRYGFEIHGWYQILKPLQVGIAGEYVYSRQLSGPKKGFTLPFSPPASAILTVKYQRPKFSFLENIYASVDYQLTAPQNDIVPPEETTPGYQVINIGFGGDIRLMHQMMNISFQVQNLLNNKYFNHTSYYRLINVPEPGFNFIVNISVPFSFTRP